MTIKQVEPLKFKGNKTWYLHKLSEKGADAMKCDFPNGDDTFTETTIQAAIKELAANGGGSAESLIPKRVIYINPDKETVAGECYPTFAAAQAYMETYPEQKFCVELPAGDFGTTADDHITLSEQWEIHGNKTKIVAPIDTKIVETGNMQGVYNTSRSIQNCMIVEGFVVDTGATGIKCYHVYDSVILKMSTDTGDTPTTAAIIASNSTIKTGDESGTSTKWFVGMFVSCIVENINIDGNASPYGFRFISCYIGSANTNGANVTYEGCDFTDPSGGQLASSGNVAVVCCNIAGVSISADDLFVYCSRLIAIHDISIISEFNVYNSFVRTDLDENKTIPSMTIEHSALKTEGGSNTLIITELNCDAVSYIESGTVIPTRNMNIVYSTDGGTTMSNDPTGGATHYGICKDLTETTVDVNNYMWFPMPE